MYRIFQDFRWALQDLLPQVVLSPQYHVRNVQTVTKLRLFTVNGIQQKRKYCSVCYSLRTYYVLKYGWIPNSRKHILFSEDNSYSTGHINCILWNRNVHDNMRNSPQLVSLLSQNNSVLSRSYPTFLRRILTFFLLGLGLPSGQFPPVFPTKTYTHFSHTWRMSRLISFSLIWSIWYYLVG